MLLTYTAVSGQDLHFSDYYHTNMALSPAMTGMMNSHYHLGVAYRTQWGTVGTPYRTMAVNGEMTFGRKPGRASFGSVGVLLLNDVSGVASYRQTGAHLSMAWHQSLSGDGGTYLSAGGQYGMVQQAIDGTKLTFDSQYDGNVIDPNLQSGENINNATHVYHDWSAGILYNYSPSDIHRWFIGVSGAHLNRPRQGLLGDERIRQNIRYSIQAGGDWMVTDRITLQPRAYVLYQGKASSYTFGSWIRYDLSDYREGAAFAFGTLHRLEDAQVIMARMEWRNYGVSVHYDVNVSSLARASRTYGGFEMAAFYRHPLYDMGKRIPVRCADF